MNTWADILAQESAVQTLRRAWRGEHLPHGLIFAGPVGVGKGTTAAVLAALMLCEKPLGDQSRGDEPCGSCQSCRLCDAGNHPDLHVITKELIRYHDRSGTSKGTTLSIQVIRPELIEPAWRTPTMGRAKVFIVEQADLMAAQAQNAILKTLEEPAGRTLIVLLTDQAESLLPTVRSRCQIVTFLPLPDEVVIAQLQRHGIEKALAAEAAALAQGSLGLALQWIADGVVEAGRQLTEQLQLIEGGRPCRFGALVKEAADAYAQKQLERDELASKEQATRQGLLLYLDMAGQHYRRQLGSCSDPERICAAIEAIARAREYLDANVNVAVALQQLELALCRAA